MQEEVRCGFAFCRTIVHTLMARLQPAVREIVTLDRTRLLLDHESCSFYIISITSMRIPTLYFRHIAMGLQLVRLAPLGHPECPIQEQGHGEIEANVHPQQSAVPPSQTEVRIDAVQKLIRVG